VRGERDTVEAWSRGAEPFLLVDRFRAKPDCTKSILVPYHVLGFRPLFLRVTRDGALLQGRTCRLAFRLEFEFELESPFYYTFKFKFRFRTEGVAIPLQGVPG